MADVFVSYHRDDRDDAERYAAALGKLGYSVFWNEQDLPAGSIDRLTELDEARFVLVLWTHLSTDARQVFVEASDAELFGRYIGIAIEDQIPLARRFAEHQNTKVIDPSANYCDVKSLTGFVGLILDTAHQGEIGAAQPDPRKVSAALNGTVEAYFTIKKQEDPVKIAEFLEFIEKGADLEWVAQEQLQTVSQPKYRLRNFSLKSWREFGFAAGTVAALVAIVVASMPLVDIGSPKVIAEMQEPTGNLPLGPGYDGKIDPAANGRHCGENTARLSGLCLSTDITELNLGKRLLASAADLSEIRKFKQLQILDLSGIPVRDLAPLSGMSGLRELILKDTEVNDLSPISGLVDLQKLDLQGTEAKNLAPLLSLVSLETLCLADSETCSGPSVDDVQNILTK